MFSHFITSENIFSFWNLRKYTSTLIDHNFWSTERILIILFVTIRKFQPLLKRQLNMVEQVERVEHGRTGQTWSNSTPKILVRPCSTLFDHVRPCSTMFDHVHVRPDWSSYSMQIKKELLCLSTTAGSNRYKNVHCYVIA